MKFRLTSSSQGFTVIELVAVIFVLAVLSATALPRFMDVSEEAHDAVTDGVMGAMATGVVLFHGQYMVEGQPPAGTAIEGFGEGVLQTDANGYPAGIDGGASIEDSADCVAVFRYLTDTPLGIAQGLDNGTSSLPEISDFTGPPSDYVAVYYDLASGPFYSEPTCVFAYMGQYTGSGNDEVPVIQYDGLTGAITREASL